MQLNKQFDTLFLDRDGVLNKKIENGYVLEVSQIEILPGIADFLQFAKPFFKRIIVVSNQRCIGRGLLAMPELEVINEIINRSVGSLIDRFYICPHLDEDNCDCRKPKAGLFLRAQRDFEIDFGKSWMIGDSESDMIPAKILNIITFYRSMKKSVFADRNFKDFKELVEVLKGSEETDFKNREDIK